MSILLDSYRFNTVSGTTATGAVVGRLPQVAAAASSTPAPLQYSGLKVWLEAGTGKITHSSDAISQWSDSSPVGTNHANQGTAASKPTRVTRSSRDVASFDGGDSLIVTNVAGIQVATATLVVAVDMVSMPQYGGLCMKRSGGSGFEIYPDLAVASGDTTASLNFVADNTTNCVLKSGGGQYGKHTFSVRCGATNVVTKWDGAGGSTTAATFTTSGADFYVGGSNSAPSAGTSFVGEILEWCFYDNDIGATGAAAVEAYFKEKHGTA